ncbi:MAG TPA: TetR family transcriptional regulator [Baekduia sp.]|nr:TetR family transcriptional regulator [Baekduia sp.]
MSSVADKASSRERTPARRRHDAEASRRALLDAAAALFDERGYDAATVREIGERAGVDAALIARYFGSKEGLYLATLEGRERRCLEGSALEVLAQVLGHSEEHGTGPILRAMASATLTDSMREQVTAVMGQRVIDPLAGRLQAAGASDPRLQAELVMAIVVGIAMTRAGGTLPALAEAPLSDVVALLEPAVDALEAGGRR